MDRILAWVDSLGRTLNAFERLALNTIAALAPWLSPLIPAWLAYHNLHQYLDFPVELALVSGIVVECLGLSAIHITYQLWDWNDTHAGRAPTRLAASVGGFYLAIVITVNVLLDIGHASVIQIVAKALLSMISIASGVVLALKAQHTRRVMAIEKSNADAMAHERAEKKQLAIERRAQLELQKSERLARIEANKQVRLARIQTQAEGKKHSVASGNASSPDGVPVAKRGTYEEFRMACLARNGDGPLDAKKAMAMFGVPSRTAYNWLKRYQAEMQAEAEHERL